MYKVVNNQFTQILMKKTLWKTLTLCGTYMTVTVLIDIDWMREMCVCSGAHGSTYIQRSFTT